jgi:N-acetylglucosamine kinase-like BadF-type ATPase
MKAMWAVCIDGGQTKTAVVLYDGDGRAVGEWTDEPVVHYARPGGLDSYRRMAENVRGRLTALAPREPVAICFSLTGYHGDTEEIPRAIEAVFAQAELPVARLRIVPDYWGNWYSVTKGAPGIVVISGGGTVAYGRNRHGRSLRLGGWGHLLGDEGSGYWIGLEAVKIALKAQAGIAPPTGMAKALFDTLEADEEHRLLAAFYSGRLTDKQLALLVPIVNAWAELGGAAAVRIMEEGAGHLFELAAAIDAQLGDDLPIYLSGGVFNASRLMSGLSERFAAAGMSGRVVKADADPAEGIYRLAVEGLA